VQVTASDSTQNYLHDAFVMQLHRGITGSLNRVGKGWFNIHESNHRTYAYSKLKKLLTVVRFMMEDSLRYLVLSSLSAFAKFTSAVCDVAVTVHSTRDVAIERAPRVRRHPLLTVSLLIHPETLRVVFSDNVEAYPGQMVALMLRGIAASEGLCQLEPLVMTKLYWAYRPKLQSVHPQEEEVLAMMDAVHAAWTRVVRPLLQYESLFRKYEPLLERNNEAHVKALIARGSQLTLAEVQAELVAAEKLLEAIQQDIPASVRPFAFLL
jgi:dynein heavy chain, axonemal